MLILSFVLKCDDASLLALNIQQGQGLLIRVPYCQVLTTNNFERVPERSGEEADEVEEQRNAGGQRLRRILKPNL